MISEEQFVKLLAEPEGKTIDFKRDPYRKDVESRGSFVKDILAMGNTPRSGPAYIIIGVKAYPDGRRDLVGLTESQDDAEYQDKINSVVFPRPTFLYETVQHDGLAFGVISIQPVRSGPYVATQDVAKTRAHVMYWRRGSKNVEADYVERQDIAKWFQTAKQGYAETSLDSGLKSAWKAFLDACQEFDLGRVYILIVGAPLFYTNEDLKGIAAAPWSFVYDFDRTGSENGVAAAVLPELRKNISVHQLVLGDNIQTFSSKACYWYHAAGRVDRVDTIPGPTWLDWNKKYGFEVQTRMRSLAASRRSKPVTIVSLCADETFVEALFTAASSAFTDGIDFVVAAAGAGSMGRLNDLFSASLIDIKLGDVAAGLETMFTNSADPSEANFLPTKSGVARQLDAEELRYLEEEFEILTSQIGAISELEAGCSEYLRGNTITWFALGLRCDVDRAITQELARIVNHDLDIDQIRHRSTTRVNLYHMPGAGGTTVARRIAWDLHNRVPCVLLRSTRPLETIGRLESIFQKCDLPILIIVEGADVTEDAYARLYELARVRQVAAVFLRVQRHFDRIEARDRTLWLDGSLSKSESEVFVYKLSADVPARRQKLVERANMAKEERTPFYFGLEAYESAFAGLSKYVEARMESASPEQRRILCFLAIAYHYGQQAIEGSAFATILHADVNRPVDLTKVLSQQLLGLVRQNEDKQWRPSHALVAIEILRQLLAPGGSQDDRLWQQSLSEWALLFAEFCRGDGPVPSEDLKNLAERCFLERDDNGRAGGANSFAPLILDMPVPESRLAVLLRLAELFSEESHFWAHLGRFYSLQLREHDNALVAINRAIDLEPESGVLFHMKGMALRARLYEEFNEVRDSRHPGDLSHAIEIARSAAKAFELAREYSPFDEYGYISEVQMIFRLLEYAVRIEKAANVQAILTAPYFDPFLRESLDRAETLLGEAYRLREGDKPTHYVEECRVQLNALYGKSDIVLQGWSNMLTRNDVYRPPIRRQIVHAYLARSLSWSELTEKEVARIAELLRQNLQEERNDPRNIRLWIRAVRYLYPSPSLDSVVETLTYWKASSDDIDASLYLYALNTLRALEGNVLARDQASLFLENCRRKARLRSSRTWSPEWVGQGTGVQKLLHVSDLGKFDESGFWSGASKLARVQGTIVKINGPEYGEIEFAQGLRAFFVPGRSKHLRGRDENRSVTFALGFSYDGHRAWSVESV